jgi:hypothetical protein
LKNLKEKYMKAFKLFLSFSLMLAFFAGCKKDDFNDTSFIDSNGAPAALSVLFDITHDNTGLVTITPNGENAVAYDVYYGHGTAGPATVAAGRNTTHTYPEGVYNVRIVAHSVTGKTTEITKQLTVSFRVPENLDFTVTIDPSNNYKVSVTASALYETNFMIYYGDVPNEVGFSFLEGSTVTHTYAAIGTYNIKVVALSGGAASAQLIKPVTIVDPVLLPVTFESPTVTYAFGNFAGGVATKIANPQSNGINTSANVGKMVKNAGEVYGGATLALGTPINFSVNKVFRMKVFSPRVGAKVLLKVENLTDGSISFEKEVLTTVANVWEDMAFDYNAIDVTKIYQRIVLIFDNGIMGNGSANFTWLFDDIRQTNTLPTTLLTLPVTFDDPAVTYITTDFGGNVTTDALDPVNAANHVKSTVKTAGAQTWAGTTLGTGFTSPVPFSATDKKMSVRVYSPAAGLPVRLKLEDKTNNTHTVETEVNTTVANTWETLTFDFGTPATGTPALNLSYTFDLASIFFNFGTAGTGQTFKWDDVKFVPATATLALPLDFESSTLTYAFTNFNGGAVTVINNTQVNGINTSAKVAKMVKSAGEVYGGSYITLAAPINFSTLHTVRMKVFSPRVGAKVLLKVENLTNSGISFEKEVLTTVANTWEDLTFDYTAINAANSYQKVVLIFDNGTMGDGTANFTWLFDDIRQQ